MGSEVVRTEYRSVLTDCDSSRRAGSRKRRRLVSQQFCTILTAINTAVECSLQVKIQTRSNNVRSSGSDKQLVLADSNEATLIHFYPTLCPIHVRLKLLLPHTIIKRLAS